MRRRPSVEDWFDHIGMSDRSDVWISLEAIPASVSRSRIADVIADVSSIAIFALSASAAAPIVMIAMSGAADTLPSPVTVIRPEVSAKAGARPRDRTIAPRTVENFDISTSCAPANFDQDNRDSLSFLQAWKRTARKIASDARRPIIETPIPRAGLLNSQHDARICPDSLFRWYLSFATRSRRLGDAGRCRPGHGRSARSPRRTARRG